MIYQKDFPSRSADGRMSAVVARPVPKRRWRRRPSRAADTQEAAKLLSGARGQLGQMLETAGLRLAGFQATSSHASDSGLDTSQGSQGRSGEGGSDNAGRNNAGRHQDFSNKMANALDDHADDTGDGGAGLREGETAVLSILA